MNSLERVKTVLKGEIPYRVPVCLHNFMMAAREAGIPMEEYRRNPQAIARTHLTAVEKYGYDCLFIDTDTTVLAEAMGATSDCAHNESGRIVKPAIARLEEVERLPVIDPRLRAFSCRSTSGATPGCAIPAHTPSENIRAFIETAHREGVYD